ncbi:MAG: RluA family pseudouridine synthase [Burkholderiaceae bacterium]|nr:RluA family pseudouridine synthase [Burkholderiaceae bacterium]
MPKAAKYIDAPAPARLRAGDAVAPAQVDDADDIDDIAPLEASAGAPLHLRIALAQDGLRLDRALADLLPAVSRSRLQQWIAGGGVRRVAQPALPLRAKDPVFAGEAFDVTPQAAPDASAFTPEPMPLSIVYADEAILVLDKPPGLVVHPAAGHWHGTLLNGLLAHDAALVNVPRAGIVHRLDADTSGLMVVARTVAAHADLVRQLQARTVTREYWAVVSGAVPEAGTIDAPIARDPRNPLKFAVRRVPAAREARTHLRRVALVECDGRTFSWVACRLETGRTHQIRVHLEHLGHPLVGDPVYRRGRPGAPQAAQAPAWARFERQALHACQLGLQHPSSGRAMHWFRPPPADLRGLMHALGFGRTDRPRAAFR